MTPGDDRGAVTLTVTVLTCVLLLVVTAMTAALTDLTGTAARARAAADATALAAAAAAPVTGGDGDTCTAAADVSQAAEVTLVTCTHPPADTSRGEMLRVMVTVRAPTTGPLTVGVNGLEASATAAVLPEAD